MLRGGGSGPMIVEIGPLSKVNTPFSLDSRTRRSGGSLLGRIILAVQFLQHPLAFGLRDGPQHNFEIIGLFNLDSRTPVGRRRGEGRRGMNG